MTIIKIIGAILALITIAGIIIEVIKMVASDII